MEKISINTEYIKLDAFLKFCGHVMSGGEAKVLISQGQVLVNGQSCLARGKKLRHGDMVALDGKEYQVTQGQ